MVSVEFFVTSLFIILAPGTGVIYTVSTGLARGRRSSVVAAAGCTLGIVPHLLAAVFGLSAILYSSSLVFSILKYLGVAYIIYLAWNLWRSSGILDFGAAGVGDTGWRIVSRAVLINLLNPKLTLFFFAFLPQFVSTGAARPTAHMLSLGGLFMLMTLIVFVGYGILASSFSDLVRKRPLLPGYIQKGFAGLLALLAIRLAFSTRE